ncbi:MAG: MOSC domain-containing protein [Flavobacteriaceae bacterium]|nr:MOSC domain-containing protein [Eudoraea sp.]NNJ37815.1 MOSC domain-containing protein [Flavobacteriaceae bacterium]
MHVIAANIAQPALIEWKGKKEYTGIYKAAVDKAIFLGKEGVSGDAVADRRVHGGVDKACYLFSADHYDFWKAQYPLLDWDWGMFGENLSISGMDESKIRIGDVFQIGEALVEVSQPREPCYKLGIKFGDQKVISEFIDHGYPGVYVRVLEEGKVCKGDELILKKQSDSSLTVKDFFDFLYTREKDPKLLELILNTPALPEKKKNKLKRYL